ncbi:hypothetical protein PVK06_017603 [Gossypium arboreum]|uniref:Uncharacterized protein n=1 Tax=Gossypium arboreum TaxID=29729 RepID=A0ABR0Q3U5_GOSAR|nr:hypothetical protein PVK06_017603 [Gossypium arboreum]
MWRNGIEILGKPSSSHDVNNESKTGTREENKNMMQKGKERARDKDSVSNSPMEKVRQSLPEMEWEDLSVKGRYKREPMEKTRMRAPLEWFERS